MADYTAATNIIFQLRSPDALAFYLPSLMAVLTDEWMAEYGRTAQNPEIVEVETGGFHYLFDIAGERLIAAWGISHGRAAHTRDKSRMAGHPLSAGSLYHRGHVIPHTLGGGTDINLVPQLGSVNIGDFRILERAAVSTPGSLYFTYWKYGDAQSQTPSGCDQGLYVPGGSLRIHPHAN